MWDALVELCVAAGDSAEEWLPVQATDIVSKLYTNTPPERLWMAEVRRRDGLLGLWEQRDVCGRRSHLNPSTLLSVVCFVLYFMSRIRGRIDWKFLHVVLFVAIIADKNLLTIRNVSNPLASPIWYAFPLSLRPHAYQSVLTQPQANVEKILLKFDQDGSTACFPQPQTQAPSHSTALVERDHSDDDTALIIRRERRTLATATTATQSYTLVGGSLGLEGLARYMPHSSARGVSWAPRYLLAAPGAKL